MKKFEKLRWIQQEILLNAHSSLMSMVKAAPATATRAAAAAGLADVPEHRYMIELPDLRAYETATEKAEILLEAAAAIEHALLVQYLYGAYSLKSGNDPSLAEEQQRAVDQWRNAIVRIALEEMAHLALVQNLLLLLDLTPTFQREEFPPRSGLFPFPLHLEPLDQVSLAKYVVTESPESATGIGDIVVQATEEVGMEINRVGVLYGLLGVLFSKQDQLEEMANKNKHCTVFRELSCLAYVQDGGQSSRWHLTDDAFHPESVPFQATKAWNSPRANMRVRTTSNREEAIEVIVDIAVQGEGPMGTDSPGEVSHFQQFLDIYRGTPGVVAFPAKTGNWTPTLELPTDPKISDDPSDPNHITNAKARDWARLSDLRYALMLGIFEQYFLIDDETQRITLVGQGRTQMILLRILSDTLVTLDRNETAGQKAALPFTLPADLLLPETFEEQMNVHIQRLNEMIQLEDAMLASHSAGNTVLPTQMTADRALLVTFEQWKSGGGGSSTAEEEMIQLLQSKQAIGSVVHDLISVGGGNLSGLFMSGDYHAILEFLKSSKAVRGSVAGQDLVVPGDTDQSAVVKQMESGVMAGVLSTAEIDVVKNWINSLS